MRLLFTKLKHIGDALIMTPMLTAVRTQYPEAEIHVVVRHGTEGILAGCPAIDYLHAAATPKGERQAGFWWRDLQLMGRLWRIGFDYAFELGDGDRGRMIAWLSGAKQIYANDTKAPINWWWRSRFTKFSNKQCSSSHRVEKDYTTVRLQLDLPREIPPLCFTQNDAEPWPDQSPFLLFHPATRWQRKRWPTNRWIELGRKLAKDHDIVVSCGPETDEIDEAQAITEGIGKRASSTKGRLSWPQLAGALRAANLFVGVDTAAMHLAAACQCPIVGLFGQSIVSQWRPWKASCQIIHPGEWMSEKKISQHSALEIMKEIPTDKVLTAAREMMRAPISKSVG